MYYGKLLRQIADAIRQLTGLPQDLAGISKKIDEYTKTVGAANECEQQEEKVRQEWRKEVLAEYKQAERDKATKDDRHYRVQNSLRWATWLAFIAAAIYACVAYQQWQELTLSNDISMSNFRRARIDASSQLKQFMAQTEILQNELKATETQFQMSERPVVVVQGLALVSPISPKEPAMEVGHPLGVNITYINVGKSVALRFNANVHLVFGAANNDIHADQMTNRPSYSDLGPGVQNYASAVARKDTYAGENVPMKPGDMINWDGTDPVIAFGELTYYDRFGNFYCTPFADAHMSNRPVDIWSVLGDSAAPSEHKKHIVGDLCPKQSIR